MIALLAFSAHHVSTYIALYLSSFDPRTKCTSKTTANKREKSTKAAVRRAAILGKSSSASLIDFM